MNQQLLPPVLCIGITGGIGSGKSYICKQLESAGHTVFYCDTEAKKIIRTDSEVMNALRELVGEEVYDQEGKLVKSVLAGYLCKGKNFSRQVDAIVHPRVAEAFRQAVETHQAALAIGHTDEETDITTLKSDLKGQLTVQQLQSLSPQHVIFMECALLFESGFDILVDTSVQVHVSAETQITRLMERDHISREKAQAWIDLQMSEDEKMKRADAYVTNE